MSAPDASTAPLGATTGLLVWLPIGDRTIAIAADQIARIGRASELRNDDARHDLAEVLGMPAPGGDRFAIASASNGRWFVVGATMSFPEPGSFTTCDLPALVHSGCAEVGIVGLLVRGSELAFVVDLQRLRISGQS